MNPEVRKQPSVEMQEVNWRGYYVEVLDPQKVERSCVDGRPRNGENPLVYQYLGGDLMFPVASALAEGVLLTWEYIEDSFRELVGRGYKIGLHRGSHKNKEKGVSDCGFADNQYRILEVLAERGEELRSRLSSDTIAKVLRKMDYRVSKEEVENIVSELFANARRLLELSEEKRVFGEALISKVEKKFGDRVKVWDLKGEHGERIAAVNLNPRTTFDTEKAAKEGNQAFNLDLGRYNEMLTELGVSLEKRVRNLIASLLLYQATEMVLVEDKGKEALQVVIIE